MTAQFTIYLTLLLSVFNTLPTIAQNDSIEDIILYNKGITLYEFMYHDLDIGRQIYNLDSTVFEDKIRKEILLKQWIVFVSTAIDYFEKVIQKFPQSEFVPEARYNAAELYMNSSDQENAIIHFSQLINSKTDHLETNNIKRRTIKEKKYQACIHLTEIYINQERYNEALKYLKLIDTYQNGIICSYEDAAINIFKAWGNTRCYAGLGDYDKALSYALPELIETEFASNEYLIDEIIDIIIQHYTPQNVLSEFETAIDNMEVKKGTKHGHNINLYIITFMNIKMQTDVNPQHQESSLEIIQHKLRNSYFVEQLKEQIKK